jgi:mannose-6-phosphate isomerase-like protein (cupin superfamily)
MPEVVDIEQKLAKLDFLHGRSSQTTPAQEDAAFAKLAKYRDGGVFAGGFSGESPWERHKNGDELVHILDGSTRLTIMMEEGPESFDLRKGMMIVVPQRHWHRFRSDQGVTVMTVTPQPTDHTTVDDPRSLE